MGNPTNAEKEILETWKRERDELTSLIDALEKRIESRSSSSNGFQNRRIDPDEFFRFSTPEAIKKFLRLVGKPARATTEIIDGLKIGGLETNYTNVYTALGRLEAKGEIAKVNENWGLNEWYPPAPRSSRPPLSRLSEGAVEVDGEPSPDAGSKDSDGSVPSEQQESQGAVPGEDFSVRKSDNKTRKDVVTEYLRQHGPATRSEILDATGIPRGTINFCLKDESRFVRGEDGKWMNLD